MLVYIFESVNLDGKGRYFLHRNIGPLSFDNKSAYFIKKNILSKTISAVNRLYSESVNLGVGIS